MKNLIDTLKNCGYDPYFVENKKEALHLAKSFIKDGISIGLGGSTTVQEIGLLDELIVNKDITLFNQYEVNISMEENIKRRRLGMLSDLYITGTNAITKDGKLVNADGSGNRVASLIFGPKKVLVIVGINKIVNNLEDAFKRIMEVAAVKNINRMNKKALEMGKVAKYNLDNIANKFTYIKADEKNRISIIIVNEKLGY